MDSKVSIIYRDCPAKLKKISLFLFEIINFTDVKITVYNMDILR